MIIAGKERGKKGTVAKALPKAERVLLEGLNLVKRHKRATRGGKGQIIEKPMSLHVSNVQLIDPKSGKPTRARIERTKGGRTRIAVKSGTTI